MRKIYETRWTSYKNRQDAIDPVMNEQFAFFDESLPLELLAMKSCSLDVIFLQEQFGIVWVTRKNTVLGDILKF